MRQVSLRDTTTPSSDRLPQCRRNATHSPLHRTLVYLEEAEISTDTAHARDNANHHR